VSYHNIDEGIQLNKIPPIDDIVRRFILLFSEQTSDSEQALQLLHEYPEFFAPLLSIINSAHFNLTTKAKNIDQAIEFAGFERVCDLLLCLVVYKTFNRVNIPALDLKEFWQDSLRRAVSARMIGEIIGLDGKQCFIAGFLQDLGFLLLFVLHPDKAVLWSEFRKREPDARYSMERNIFNMNHDQAMALLADKWALDEVLSTAIIHHHNAEETKINALTLSLSRVLYCADWLASVYSATDKSFVINRCRKILTENFSMEIHRAEELLVAMPDKIDLSALILGVNIKKHINFSQLLYAANIQLAEDNASFQQLTLRLDKAIEERDKLAAELNRELSLARKIQESLLPAEMGKDYPLLGVNVSARDLSGDFYDYFTLEDGRIYFNIGDVSGKGINAALLMAKTSSLFRCLGKRIDDPEELLAQINIELCETSIRGMFVTMIAGIYDPESKKLKLVNAGNPPALLFYAPGLATEIDAKGPPLGVLSEAKFPAVEIELNNNSLYMFSDGVTESFTDDGEMLGISGLFKAIAKLDTALKPIERLNKITDRLKKTSFPFRDDVTLLLLEAREPLIKS
jgi:serine phosphatase RsbU (regulator of sigma subunit)/HD-like signal output (HDOD) protein